MTQRIDREQLKENILRRCPGPVISRSLAADISGGLIGDKSLRNYDSLGKGPTGRVKLGSRAGYLSESFADWLAERIVHA